MAKLILAGVPLGNSGDASLRLRETIESVAFVAAEDSRRFTRLCRDLNVRHHARVISFFEGNETERLDELLTILKSGNDILVVTDAGMPSISDPGYRLVRAAIDASCDVVVLPGPSAVLTALILSGLPTDRFTFEGFPPRTAGSRNSWFEELAEEKRTMVFFEAPHRLHKSLISAATSFGGNRRGVICREMTKTYEETVRGTLETLITWSEGREILGEITMVIAGFNPATRIIEPTEIIKKVKDMEAAGILRKEAIAMVSKELLLPKRVIFDLMVADKSNHEN